jgi:hypothetical protein
MSIMDDWYRVTFVSEDASLIPMMHEEFLALLQYVEHRPGMALIGKGNLDFPRQFFFTPACFPDALPLVRKYGGLRCDLPENASELSSLGGDKAAMDIYFGPNRTN